MPYLTLDAAHRQYPALRPQRAISPFAKLVFGLVIDLLIVDDIENVVVAVVMISSLILLYCYCYCYCYLLCYVVAYNLLSLQ